jgi:hypothetical protein
MNEEPNNPFKIVEEMKEEFQKRDIEVTNIQHEDHFGGSWMIDFVLNEHNYRFVWDGRESWLIHVYLGKSKTQQQDQKDLDLYRYDKKIKTRKEKEALEKFVTKNIKKSLDKLKQI